MPQARVTPGTLLEHHDERNEYAYEYDESSMEGELEDNEDPQVHVSLL